MLLSSLLRTLCLLPCPVASISQLLLQLGSSLLSRRRCLLSCCQPGAEACAALLSLPYRGF